jgi:hypothetical protein
MSVIMKVSSYARSPTIDCVKGLLAIYIASLNLEKQENIGLTIEDTELLDGSKFCKKKRLFFFSIQQRNLSVFFPARAHASRMKLVSAQFLPLFSAMR